MRETCREAVIEAFIRLEQRNHRKEFGLEEVLKEVLAVTKEYKESTIRTHISSRMCVQAPLNHATKFENLDRVDVGRYRRIIWR